ncbi:MAG: hypothetical protein COB37_08270 [Kordiimonadales bacterium]|nr:MAG: hypothetical protein COB37_08270 [Kordiimonadales bacterium]
MPNISAVTAVKDAYTALYKHPSAILKIVGPMIILVALIDWFTESNGGSASSIAMLFVSIFIAFSWHREVLLENPILVLWATKENKDGSENLHNRAYGQFMWRSFGLAGTLVACALIIGLPFYQFAKDETVLTILVVALILFVLIAPWFFRSALIFPAVAIGSPEITLSNAWALSKGQGLRILAGYILAAVPMFLVIILVGFLLLTPVVGSAAYYIDLLFGAFVTCVSTAIWAGVNSSIYRQLGPEISDFLKSNETNITAAEKAVPNES